MKQNVLEAVGQTPLVRLNRVIPPGHAQVIAKLELQNISGSAKIRPALAMVEAAEKDGYLKPGSLIVEASSGNAGIGMAAVGAVKGYRVIIVMPDNASIERQQLIKAYGAEVVLTPAEERTGGAIKKANEICADTPGAYYPKSMENPNNPMAHYSTTAEEIFAQYPRKIDAFLAGTGSGGTLSGIGRALREKYPDIKIFGVNPAEKKTFVAGVGRYEPDGSFPPVYDVSLLSGFMSVTDEDTLRYTRLLASQEGILAGPSSGMVTAAAVHLGKTLGSDKTILVVFMDTGERYLSTGLYD